MKVFSKPPFTSELRSATILHWHPICFAKAGMHSTFFQKVIICMVAAFLTACLIQWARVFVEGADDALNSGYRKDEPAIFSH